MNAIYLRLAHVLVFPFLLLSLACGGAAEEADVPETAAPAEDIAAEPEPTVSARINVNTATEEELLSIPEVGDRMAHEFEEYRPYVSIRQFRREIGKYVDDAQVARYEQYIFVPVNPKESDAETLRQLPGVEPAEAESLIAARPYASRDAFLAKLAEYVTEEELATAPSYLAAE